MCCGYETQCDVYLTTSSSWHLYYLANFIFNVSVLLLGSNFLSYSYNLWTFLFFFLLFNWKQYDISSFASSKINRFDLSPCRKLQSMLYSILQPSKRYQVLPQINYYKFNSYNGILKMFKCFNTNQSILRQMCNDVLS